MVNARRAAWLPVLRALGAVFWIDWRLMRSRATTVFDARGNLADRKNDDPLRNFMIVFVALAAHVL